MEQIIISWQAQEFVHHEKNFGWYLTFFVVVLMLIIYEIILKDYFAALSFFIMGILLFLITRYRPIEVTIRITNKSISIDDFRVPFSNIKHFWIVDHEHAKALHLETTAYLNHLMIIQLGDQDPEEVRQALLPYLPESAENVEHFTHKIARKLKF